MDENQHKTLRSMTNDRDWREEHFLKGGVASSVDVGIRDSSPAEAVSNSVMTSDGPHASELATHAAELATHVDYPLVDAALQSVGDRTHESNDKGSGVEVDALGREAERLVESAVLLAQGLVHVAAVKATGLKKRIQDGVRARPYVALGLIAAVAYLWGAAR